MESYRFEQQERFWDQVDKWQPESLLVDGDVFCVVTRHAAAWQQVTDWIAATQIT